MLIKRTAPNLGVPVWEWGDRALTAYCRMHRNLRSTGNGFPYQLQWLCWEVYSNFGCWRTLTKLYWSLAGSQMRYNKESGWPVLPRHCCLSSGAGWRGLQESIGEKHGDWSLNPLSSVLYHSALFPSCLVWNGKISVVPEGSILIMIFRKWRN